MRTVDPARHAARRALILEAAATVFAEHGFEKATTAGICRAAGIGSGTLFHYFPDKSAIFHALFADDLARTREVVSGLDESDPVAALFELIRHRVADAGDPLVPGLLLAAIVRASQDDEFAALVTADDAYAQAVVSRLLEAAAERGQIDGSLQPDATARWICGLTDAVYLQAGAPEFDAATTTALLRTTVQRLLEPRRSDQVEDMTGLPETPN